MDGNKLKYHIYFWIFYFLFEINAELAYLTEALKPLSLSKPVLLYYSALSEFCFLFSEIPCFYIILAIVDGKFGIFNTVWKKVMASVVMIILGTILFRIICHDFVYPVIYGIPEDIPRFSQFGIFNAVMNIIFAVALGFGFEKFRQQLELQKHLNDIKTEKYNNEIKFLKAQINPHFLFNTLNNIYGLSLKKADETPDIIMKLSKIMRFNIYESYHNIALSRDIENLKDFIDIQKLRHKNLELKFIEEIDNPSQEISPLILLQFVENAFKHGASESIKSSYIHIDLKLKDEILTYKVENSKEVNPLKDTTGIGMNNIKRQLEILYPGHILEIDSQKEKYSVVLKIYFTHGNSEKI
ncbi:sensor histidine kinase YesM [Chryseobacterium defluvii]|uniref:Sensor histidine kinase YesM n=1 Tax=Chryseobacterium defluvii TaxID=160396 RepID=A0A840KGU8_9FLAO|nr:sensor histidine kinase [Chryseobacterium defluvii]MBB4807905.1 sensor histidine kinase YesM [Chryseobacterium defluvii]